MSNEEIKKYPEPTAGAFIFNDENKLLLVKSSKWKDNSTIPGGHVEFGEKVEDTVRREVKEETSLEIYDIKFLGIQDYIKGEDFHVEKHFVFLDYSCRTNGSNVVLNEEGEEYTWASVEEALKLPLSSGVKRGIELYFKK